MKLNEKLIIAVFVVCVLAILGCSKGQTPEQSGTETPALPALTTSEAERTITGTDGLCQISSAGGWAAATGLHKKAPLQASNVGKEMYLVAFSEKKERLGSVSLEKYSETTRKLLMKGLGSPTISNPTTLTIDERPALQCRIRGLASNMKIVYIHTIVESEDYFHEILAWTLDSRYEQNEQGLLNEVKSFKEKKPEAATTAPK